MKASRLFVKWIVVTAIAGMITALIQNPAEYLLQWLAQWLTSPCTIAIVGLTQILMLWNHPQQRDRWIKLIGLQFMVLLALQVMIFFSSFFYALLAIAYLGKGSFWASFAEFNTLLLLVVGIVSHAWVQAEGLRSMWRDRVQSCYPSCPLNPAIDGMV